MIIEKEVLAYLAQNPNAEDSVEGITRWWLSSSDQYTVAEVQAALDELISRKLLVARRCPEGHVYFRANLDRRNS